MRIGMILIAAFILASCGREENVADNSPKPTSSLPPLSSAAETPASDKEDPDTLHWTLQANGSGLELALGTSKQAIIRFFCATKERALTVNVAGFRPIGSEERLSVGTGEYVVALVADTRGDSKLGGVSGVGAVPPNLESLFNGGVSASYGAQQSGPHPAPPQYLSRSFVASCAQGIASLNAAKLAQD